MNDQVMHKNLVAAQLQVYDYHFKFHLTYYFFVTQINPSSFVCWRLVFVVASFDTLYSFIFFLDFESKIFDLTSNIDFFFITLYMKTSCICKIWGQKKGLLLYKGNNNLDVT